LNDGVYESRVDAFARSGVKDDPVQITITGLRNVRRYGFDLSGGTNYRRKYRTKIESGKIRQKEKKRNGNGSELRRTQMRKTGKLHSLILHVSDGPKPSQINSKLQLRMAEPIYKELEKHLQSKTVSVMEKAL
jgi:hypothetical protein